MCQRLPTRHQHRRKAASLARSVRLPPFTATLLDPTVCPPASPPLPPPLSHARALFALLLPKMLFVFLTLFGLLSSFVRHRFVSFWVTLVPLFRCGRLVFLLLFLLLFLLCLFCSDFCSAFGLLYVFFHPPPPHEMNTLPPRTSCAVSKRMRGQKSNDWSKQQMSTPYPPHPESLYIVVGLDWHRRRKIFHVFWGWRWLATTL